MMRRSPLARPGRAVGALLLIGLAGCMVDLRPAQIRAGHVQTGDEERGRVLLAGAARAAGSERWSQQRTMTIRFSDEWRGIGRFFNHWPEPKQFLRMDLLRGSFTSRVTLLDGASRGEVWGIKNWRTYKIKDGRRDTARDDTIRFYLPTLHYFFEFPFRIQAAEKIVHVGRRTIAGTEYDLVFATWGDYEPGKTYDQYLIYINRKSRLIDLVRYTVREAGGFAEGTIRFGDYRQVNGLRLPFTQTVTLEGPQERVDPEKFFHRIQIESVRFDATAIAELAGPAGGDGDWKPAD